VRSVSRSVNKLNSFTNKNSSWHWIKAKETKKRLLMLNQREGGPKFAWLNFTGSRVLFSRQLKALLNIGRSGQADIR
jgi:hypothetical protein